jgi:hypothetical protein
LSLRHSSRNEVGICHPTAAFKKLFQLPNVSSLSPSHALQVAHFTDNCRVSIERGVGFACGFGGSIVRRG